MARIIHATATVDPSARLGQDVEIGPHAVVEADTIIGEGCRLMANAIIRRYSQLGPENVVHSFAVIGGEPQDLKFDPAAVTYVKVGRGNVFREGSTVSRATKPGGSTVLGDNNYLMTAAHVGHDSVMGNNCVMVNGSALAGHVEVADKVFLSAHVCIHQFCWVGEGVMSQGNCISTTHVPPYCMLAAVNEVYGLNRVGLGRNPQITETDRKQVQEAYRLVYRSRLALPKALEEMQAHDDWGVAAGKFRDFVFRVVNAKPPHARALAHIGRRTRKDEE